MVPPEPPFLQAEPSQAASAAPGVPDLSPALFLYLDLVMPPNVFLVMRGPKLTPTVHPHVQPFINSCLCWQKLPVSWM